MWRAFPVVVVGILGASGGLSTALQTHEHNDVDFALPERRRIMVQTAPGAFENRM